METLKEYFSYNKDYDEMSGVFYDASRKLKEIHGKNKCVDKINAETVGIKDEEVVFVGIVAFSDSKKEENIRSLSKMIFGAFFTLSSNFMDFSDVNEEWIKEHFYEVQGILRTTSFPSEYLERSLLSGVVEYFHNYQDLERSLEGNSNSVVLGKVLRKGAYSLSQDSDGLDNIYEKKSAFANIVTYPLVITFLIILLLLFILIKGI